MCRDVFSHEKPLETEAPGTRPAHGRTAHRRVGGLRSTGASLELHDVTTKLPVKPSSNRVKPQPGWSSF